MARRAGLNAKGRFSQNFLVDRSVLDAVIAGLGVRSDDSVLEIGPGVGTLTGELVAVAGRVVAVDIDPACVRATRITQRHATNLEVIEGDVMRTNPADLGFGGADGWLAAGNLPYHLTGAILSHLFEGAMPPRRGVFLVQREVAARLAAAAGDWSLATVAIRSIASVERLRDVPPASFDPSPRVHSSVICMEPAHALLPDERILVLELARRAFQMRRKTLRHALGHALAGDETLAHEVLSAAAIDPSRRPGTLDLVEWRTLATIVAARRRT